MEAIRIVGALYDANTENLFLYLRIKLISVVFQTLFTVQTKLFCAFLFSIKFSLLQFFRSISFNYFPTFFSILIEY